MRDRKGKYQNNCLFPEKLLKLTSRRGFALRFLVKYEQKTFESRSPVIPVSARSVAESCNGIVYLKSRITRQLFMSVFTVFSVRCLNYTLEQRQTSFVRCF